MEKPYYKAHLDRSMLGIRIVYSTTPGGYHPLHWHDEIEILYPLNGDIDLKINDKKYLIQTKHFAVIESNQVHSTYNHNRTSMFLCIHISKKVLESYLPNIELHQIGCFPRDITDDQFPEYRQICEFLENLTRFYMQDSPTYALEADGIILQVLGHLLRYFSTITTAPFSEMDQLTRERIQSMLSYVEEHYTEPISLQEISEHLGLGKEYFCRFFKKNMNQSFLSYLNEVRLTHVYKDLQTTDLPVSEIMEKNGWTNQKLFNRTFKELYGCTPSEVRKA